MSAFTAAMNKSGPLLMEAAIGTRLKSEYGIFHHPELDMAAHVDRADARSALHALYSQYAAIAERHALPFLAVTPTRRANRDRLHRAGMDEGIFRRNAVIFGELRKTVGVPVFVGGGMGCRGDAYSGGEALTENEAEAFHGWTARRFAEAGVDFLYAGLMPSLSESVGMARACAAGGLPYLVSFTLAGEGALADGTMLHDAIARIDESVSAPPLAYMTNCLHPTALARTLSHPANRTALVRRRFLGVSPNASSLSRDQLDTAREVHASDPLELARQTAALGEYMRLRIVGGCCGTGAAYLEAIAGMMAMGGLEGETSDGC